MKKIIINTKVWLKMMLAPNMEINIKIKEENELFPHIESHKTAFVWQVNPVSVKLLGKCIFIPKMLAKQHKLHV